MSSKYSDDERPVRLRPLHYENLKLNIERGIAMEDSQLLDECYKYAHNCTTAVAASHCHQAISPHRKWHQLSRHLYARVVDEYPTLVGHEDFNQLEVNVLLKLLSDPELKGKISETNSLKSILSWLLHDLKGRREHANSLLVNFNISSQCNANTYTEYKAFIAGLEVSAEKKHKRHPRYSDKSRHPQTDQVVRHDRDTATDAELDKSGPIIRPRNDFANRKRTKSVRFAVPDDEGSVHEPSGHSSTTSNVTLDHLVTEQRRDEAKPMKYSNAFDAAEAASTGRESGAGPSDGRGGAGWGGGGAGNYNRNNNLHNEITTITGFAIDAYRKVFSSDDKVEPADTPAAPSTPDVASHAPSTLPASMSRIDKYMSNVVVVEDERNRNNCNRGSKEDDFMSIENIPLPRATRKNHAPSGSGRLTRKKRQEDTSTEPIVSYAKPSRYTREDSITVTESEYDTRDDTTAEYESSTVNESTEGDEEDEEEEESTEEEEEEETLYTSSSYSEEVEYEVSNARKKSGKHGGRRGLNNSSNARVGVANARISQPPLEGNTNTNAIRTITIDGQEFVCEPLSSKINPQTNQARHNSIHTQDKCANEPQGYAQGFPQGFPQGMPMYNPGFQYQMMQNECECPPCNHNEKVIAPITKRKALLGMRSDGNEYNVMYMCDPRTPDLVKRMMIIPEQFVSQRFLQIPDLPRTAIEQIKSKVKSGYMSDSERERLLEMEDQELAIVEKLADERQEMSDELKLSKQKAKLDVEYKKIVKIVKDERARYDKRIADVQLAMNIEFEKAKNETPKRKIKINKKIKKMKKLQSLTQSEWVERKDDLRKKLEAIQHKIRSLKKLRLRWKLGRRLVGLRKSMLPPGQRRLRGANDTNKKTDKSVLMDRMRQLDIRKKALQRQNFTASTDLYQNMNLENMDGGQFAWNQQMNQLGLYDTPAEATGQFGFAEDPMTTGQLMPDQMGPGQMGPGGGGYGNDMMYGNQEEDFYGAGGGGGGGGPMYQDEQQGMMMMHQGMRDNDSIGSAHDLLVDSGDPYGFPFDQEQQYGDYN